MNLAFMGKEKVLAIRLGKFNFADYPAFFLSPHVNASFTGCVQL